MNTTIGRGGALRLNHWGVISAQGPDAATFLQGQLSNDVVKLGPQLGRLAAFCSAQGRMQASFVIARPAPEQFWLACSADLLAPTLKRLSMFVLRSKASLADASAHITVIGLAGDAAAAWLGTDGAGGPWSAAARLDGVAVRLPDAEGLPRWLWLGPVERADEVLAAVPAMEDATWRWLEVRSGVAQVVAATANQFVPQMLNYELVGGVDFKKGCYPGQEVVARSQYLGKLKRRAFLLEGPVGLAPGQEVFSSLDPAQPAGAVALAAVGPSGSASALVELKIAAAEGAALHLGGPEGPPLVLQPLPYPLPHETAPPAT